MGGKPEETCNQRGPAWRRNGQVAPRPNAHSQGDPCAVRNVLKQLSGARIFFSSGTEDCELSAPRPPFSQVPLQTPFRDRMSASRLGSSEFAARRRSDRAVHFRSAVARLRDPCGGAGRAASRQKNRTARMPPSLDLQAHRAYAPDRTGDSSASSQNRTRADAH